MEGAARPSLPAALDSDIAGPKDAVAPAWSRTEQLAYAPYRDLGKVGFHDVDVRVRRRDGSQAEIFFGGRGDACGGMRTSWAPDAARLVWSATPCSPRYPTLRVISTTTGASQTIGHGRDADWRPR